MGRLKPDAIAAGRKIALDTVALVYFLERHAQHYPTAQRLFHRIESGEISAILSSLVFAELLVPAYRAGDLVRATTITRLLTNFPNMEVVSVSPAIASEAARLRAHAGLRTPDAIHAATAILYDAEGIITNDKSFSRLTDTIDVWMFEGE